MESTILAVTMPRLSGMKGSGEFNIYCTGDDGVSRRWAPVSLSRQTGQSGREEAASSPGARNRAPSSSTRDPRANLGHSDHYASAVRWNSANGRAINAVASWNL